MPNVYLHKSLKHRTNCIQSFGAELELQKFYLYNFPPPVPKMAP